MTLQRVNALLEDVATATARALSEFEALAVRATELQADAADDLKELRQWMGLVSMDMGLLTGKFDRPTIDGHDVRLDAMREGIGEITLAEARATILLKSVISLHNVLDAGARHLTGADALTDTFDSTSEQVQSAVSEAREAERRRLASEIHDGPAQVLANAVNLVEVTEHVAKRHPEQIGDELRQVRQFLKEGVDEVRQFMQDLRPTILETLGLEESLDRFTTQYCARWSIKSTFNREGEPLPKLAPMHELATYRILQESLRNVQKHAGPDVSVGVSVICDLKVLRLTIADDGIGFDPMLVAPKVSSGEGILGMRERAASVHGQLTIESRPGEGSTVTFTLPHDGKPDSTHQRPSDAGQGGPK
jgi:two-component system sensor histidine kinase DegS